MRPSSPYWIGIIVIGASFQVGCGVMRLPSAYSVKEIPIPIEELEEEIIPIQKVKTSFSHVQTTSPEGAKKEKVWIWQETEDCLWNIAKEYYGNPYLWPRIYEANKDLIKDPDVIFPKQKIIIPPLEERGRRLN